MCQPLFQVVSDTKVNKYIKSLFTPELLLQWGRQTLSILIIINVSGSELCSGEKQRRVQKTEHAEGTLYCTGWSETATWKTALADARW